LIDWTQLGRSVEGFNPLGRSQLTLVFDWSVEGCDPKNQFPDLGFERLMLIHAFLRF
jgi:hypothetical protein